MSHLPIDLNIEESAVAYDLWEGLVNARTRPDLDAAREAVRAAPTHVRNAVVVAHLPLWANGKNLEAGSNPFQPIKHR